MGEREIKTSLSLSLFHSHLPLSLSLILSLSLSHPLSFSLCVVLAGGTPEAGQARRPAWGREAPGPHPSSSLSPFISLSLWGPAGGDAGARSGAREAGAVTAARRLGCGRQQQPAAAAVAFI